MGGVGKLSDAMANRHIGYCNEEDAKKECKHCGIYFKPNHPETEFCSFKCEENYELKQIENMENPNFITHVNGKELPKRGKANALIADGGMLTDGTFKKDLVCVIEGQFSDNAFFVPDEARLNCLSHPNYAEGNRIYLIMKDAEALVS